MRRPFSVVVRGRVDMYRGTRHFVTIRWLRIHFHAACRSPVCLTILLFTYASTILPAWTAWRRPGADHTPALPPPRYLPSTTAPVWRPRGSCSLPIFPSTAVNSIEHTTRLISRDIRTEHQPDCPSNKHALPCVVHIFAGLLSALPRTAAYTGHFVLVSHLPRPATYSTVALLSSHSTKTPVTGLM